MDDRVPGSTVRAQQLDAVGRLAPGITHDLNNQLAAIAGFAELLRLDARMPDDLRSQAELLARESRRTRRTIQALLEFIRARPAERHPTSIRSLIDAVLVLHAYRLESGSIDVRLDVADDLPTVELDRQQLELVFVNLVQDATDALLADGGRGTLRIDAVRDGATIRVSVRHEATERPERSAPGAERELAWRVSSTIVKAHHGTLVRQPGPGAGATFSVTLPVSAATDAPQATPPPPRERARPVRILVLDDEDAIRTLLEKWLRGMGYEPTLAASGQEAVALVRTTPFDAVLCDHRMAGMSGTEVFNALVAVRPELDRRVVFMSGDVLNPELRDFVRERGVGLLPKPFDLAQVQATLDAVLRTA